MEKTEQIIRRYLDADGELFRVEGVYRLRDSVKCCGGMGTLQIRTSSKRYRYIDYDGKVLRYRDKELDKLSERYVWVQVYKYMHRVQMEGIR